jgi:hypothetical protein
MYIPASLYNTFKKENVFILKHVHITVYTKHGLCAWCVPKLANYLAGTFCGAGCAAFYKPSESRPASPTEKRSVSYSFSSGFFQQMFFFICQPEGPAA